MRTPMQELIEQLQNKYEQLQQSGDLVAAMYVQDAIELAHPMLEKEKEVMIGFAYKFGDEPLLEITKWYDKQFNINEIRASLLEQVNQLSDDEIISLYDNLSEFLNTKEK